ncbi:hypothetical protein LXT21_06835 [Myxococcus sp. K38C18041901]|uniref:hypothetical protein n=1 Tax=Myxococcus guangdongensis TaxID=2906760 RepID=UPI0020A7AE1A|nr:hypothetical protein [Myxococcus guangdongensis]MCP3058481.1 hypothetical protein [Myxococcus guangdongensis]
MFSLLVGLTASLLAAAPVAKGDACQGKVRVHRAWVFRGGATVQPSPSAELVAIDFAHRDAEPVRVQLQDGTGKDLASDFQWVLLDDQGAPVDRFFESLGAAAKPRRLALITAVPQGTRALKLAFQGMCTVDLTVQARGPEWPPLPQVELRSWTRQGRSATALVSARGLLDGELPTGVARQGNKLRQPLAAIAVDAKGQRLARGTLQRRYFLVRYWLDADSPELLESHSGPLRLPPLVEAPLPAPLMKALTRVEDLGLESDDPYEARRFGLSPRP